MLYIVKTEPQVLIIASFFRYIVSYQTIKAIFTGSPEGADKSSNDNKGDEGMRWDWSKAEAEAGRGMRSREVRRYHWLTVTWLTVYVRRAVNVVTSTPDRCTHGTPWCVGIVGWRWRGWRYTSVALPWVDSLHTYCHVAPSVAIKRERLNRFWQTKAYINPWNIAKSDILLDFM